MLTIAQESVQKKVLTPHPASTGRSPTLPRTPPAVFKKSNTCGSLFAKCSCNSNENTSSKCVQKSTESTIVSSPDTTDNKLQEKRYSSPEITSATRNNNTKKTHHRKTKYSECLRHPEIPFPLTDLLDRNLTENHHEKQSRYNNYLNLSNLHYPDLVCDSASQSNLLYLKYTALANRSQSIPGATDDLSLKILRDFGAVNDNMGSGMSAPTMTTVKDATSEFESAPRPRLSQSILCGEGKRKSSVIEDYEYLKTVVQQLKRELSDLEIKYGALESDLQLSKKELNSKEAEVTRLQCEVHKLKSVLQQATSFNNGNYMLTSLQEQHAMANKQVPSSNVVSLYGKRQGVSAESSDISQPSDIAIQKHEKDFRSKQLIKDAIMDNDFLKHLDSLQVREIVDCMYPKELRRGSFVIREGDAGAHLYVSAEGKFEVIKDNNVLGYMGPGKAFGELAILYNCTRTASIRVVADSKVWVLDRKVFQQIMVRTGLQRLQENIKFLRSVPLLQNLSCDVLAKIADVLEVVRYNLSGFLDTYLKIGDFFNYINCLFILFLITYLGRLEEEEIRTLKKGDYFGEQALLKEDCRTASVIALCPGVECLTLDRDSFIQLIGELSELREKCYGDEHRSTIMKHNSSSISEFEHIKLDDLDIIATLGVGGFGRVELVQYTHDPSLTFALKCLKKQHIVETQQQDHVFSEKMIMMSCRSPFICRLYKTFKDSKYVYMLLEACLGGEVWTILRDRGCFDEPTTRFITACVVEAFDYLHTRGIIYRDLKPENLLLDAQGYVKICDFGFSKRLGYSSKTWTFCGTPEYVAPETILNKGHDRAVDYWALGILMFELMTGSPPFTAADPMATYNLILKGIDMIDFTKKNVGRSAQSLIKKLCRDSPSERLGYQRGGIQDIKKHKWYQGFDWDGLKSRMLPAPLVQQVRSACDTSNFDSFSKDKDIPPDDFSDWDIDF
ncbi:cGMP-dependent protein kinase, isozyme 1-like [Agrilus planipennis]|uniref:cGMP-dependent protein kinase n=1 Tax=Agrilus planipennis TaxID=224129 RepID=A0A7F5RL61_AGRPL|nr:cGMP-dependent protein kinase, isozyme 1-like [Agrilus planipennis]